MRVYDDIVVGAGIVGLALARRLSMRGSRVLVVDQHDPPNGASSRNFGTIWPIGQPSGEVRELALRSRNEWMELARDCGFWCDPVGSLFLCYSPAELALCKSFAADPANASLNVSMLDARTVPEFAPFANTEGLLGGLHSPTEVCVQPREVASKLPAFLSERGVELRFGCAVWKVEPHRVQSFHGELHAERVWVCCGDQLPKLFPDLAESSGFSPCKLQMMSASFAEAPARIGPVHASGLTLLHYGSFEKYPERVALLEKLEAERKEERGLGIHVLVAQHAAGELIIGDSHIYGPDARSPFDSARIDELILQYLRGFFRTSQLSIRERWHGIYAKTAGRPWLIHQPLPDVKIVTGLGGAGMTLSLGLAEKVTNQVFGNQESEPIELVVFDLAGTTVADNDSVARCLIATLARHEVSISIEDANRVMGLPKPVAVRLLLERTPSAARLRDRVNEIHDEFERDMRRFYETEAEVEEIPGSSLVFMRLRKRGIKVGLNTGFSATITECLLRRLQWSKGTHFDAVVSSDQVASGRPAPDMIHKIMGIVGVSHPRRVVKVGDTPSDLLEGKAAGCGLVVGVLSGAHRRDELSLHPHDFLVSSVAEIPDVIAGFF